MTSNNNSLFLKFKNQNSRNYAVDFLKLFASLLVVLSHCIMKYVYNGGTANPFFNMIWLTQMPLFMFASGLVAPKQEKLTHIVDYFRRELRNAIILLTPCLTYLLINSIAFKIPVLSLLYDFYKNPESNLWFLFVLFLIHCIFDFGVYISTKIKHRLGLLIPVLVSILFSGFLAICIVLHLFDGKILGTKLLSYYIPFYCLGYLTTILFKSKIATKKHFNLCFYILLAMCCLSFFFISFYFESIHSFDDFDIKLLLIRIIGSVSSIVLFLFFSDRITNIRIFASLSKFGAFSLESYYVHMFILKFLNYSSSSVGAQWAIAFGTWATLIVSVALFIIACYNIPFLHLAIFGKSYSRYEFEKCIPKIFL